MEDHAWFVAYAPADDPRIAVAVLVEHGGHGGDEAGPLARRVIAAGLSEPRAARPVKMATGRANPTPGANVSGATRRVALS